MIVPAVGAIPDLLNAGIHTLRGNYTDAAMSVFFAIPIVGDAAAAGNKLKKGADKVGDVLHSADNAVDSAKAAENAASASKNAAKNADNTLDVTKIAPKVDTKPTYRTNPQHDPHSPLFNPRKTPEPSNAADIFLKAKKDPSKEGAFYGIVDKKTVYRFFDSGDGTAHFSGMVVGKEAKYLINRMKNW